jgi:DNA-directed RNA polymerase sigma subunit (sigma70/sigma32)
MFESDPVKVYLSEMSKVPPMTREQELECTRHIRARDEQTEIAEKDLLEANLALVVSIVEKHPSDHIHILDLIICGNDALMIAVRAFADSDADNFPAFAATFIERAIEHAVITSRNC